MAFKDRLYDVPVVGTALRVQDRYKADAGDQFAAAIGFFGFLSLFPLIVLALSVAGFVLAGRPDADVLRVAAAIEDAIPGFSAALGGDCAPGVACQTGVATALESIIANRGGVGIIGLASLLLTGLRITNAAQTVTLKVFRVDLLALSGWKLRLQQVGALAVLGLLAILGVGAASAVGVVARLDPTGATAAVLPLLAIVATLLADLVLFVAAYRLFATRSGPGTRALLPGALLAAIGWTVLKLFGATWVSNQVADASELYGALGGVIALLLLFYLVGRLYVYGAELSAVRLAIGTEPASGREVDADRSAPDGGPGPVEGATPGDHPSEGDGSATNASEDEPPPLPPALGPDERSPAVTAATRERLARTAATAPRDGGPRHAVAFALAVGAVGGLVAALRPWEREEA